MPEWNLAAVLSVGASDAGGGVQAERFMAYRRAAMRGLTKWHKKSACIRQKSHANRVSPVRNRAQKALCPFVRGGFRSLAWVEENRPNFLRIHGNSNVKDGLQWNKRCGKRKEEVMSAVRQHANKYIFVVFMGGETSWSEENNHVGV